MVQWLGFVTHRTRNEISPPATEAVVKDTEPKQPQSTSRAVYQRKQIVATDDRRSRTIIANVEPYRRLEQRLVRRDYQRRNDETNPNDH